MRHGMPAEDDRRFPRLLVIAALDPPVAEAASAWRRPGNSSYSRIAFFRWITVIKPGMTT